MANLRAILKSSSKIKEYSTTSQDQKINPRVDATVMAIPSLKVKFKPNLLRWVRHGPKAGCTYYDPALAVGFRARAKSRGISRARANPHNQIQYQGMAQVPWDT